MKERPILFSAPMIRALLAGTKTQTRRIVKLPSAPNHLGTWEPTVIGGPGVRDSRGREHPAEAAIWHTRTGKIIACPYGAPGDRLWVREAFTHITGNGIRVHYRADGEPTDRDGRVLPTEPGLRRWSPSIHMPRKASRISLDITNVRVERLHDISEADAKAEGVERDAAPCDHTRLSCEEIGCMGPTYRSTFAELWQSINGEESWDASPWVWVVSFSRVEAQERAA